MKNISRRAEKSIKGLENKISEERLRECSQDRNQILKPKISPCY